MCGIYNVCGMDCIDSECAGFRFFWVSRNNIFLLLYIYDDEGVCDDSLSLFIMMICTPVYK